MGKIFVVIMMLSVITLLVVDFFIPFVTVAFRGLIGIIAHWDDASNKRDQDISIMVLIKNIGDQIFADERSNAWDQLGLFWCLVVVLLLTFIFPVLNMVFLLYTSMRSLTIHQQKVCFVIAEILNIWACLDVLIVTAVVAMSPLGMVFELVQLPPCVSEYKPFLDRTLVPLEIMNKEDTWCYYVYAMFNAGTVIILLTASYNFFVSQFILRLLEMSISNRESRFKMIDADYSHTRDLTHTRPCGHELMMILNRCLLYCIAVTRFDDKEDNKVEFDTKGSSRVSRTVPKVTVVTMQNSIKDDSELFGISDIVDEDAATGTFSSVQRADPERDPMRAMSL